MDDNREYARIPTHLRAWVRPVEEDELESMRVALLTAPSIWAPRNERQLHDMVVSGSGEEGVLAQAVLDLSAQIVRLRSRVFDEGEKMSSVDLVQLSGGGGQFTTTLPLGQGDLLEIRFDDDDDAPPVRAVVRLVHCSNDRGEGFGFAYEVIHPRDQERLVRMIYSLQRRALRRSADREPAAGNG